MKWGERPHLFMLDGHEPVGTFDVLKWAQWLETAQRTVMRTKLIDGSVISTVFLGLDHGWDGRRPPILFETAILSEAEWNETLKRRARECDIKSRYATWAEAEAGHMEWIEQCVPAHLIELTTKEMARDGTD